MKTNHAFGISGWEECPSLLIPSRDPDTLHLKLIATLLPGSFQHSTLFVCLFWSFLLKRMKQETPRDKTLGPGQGLDYQLNTSTRFPAGRKDLGQPPPPPPPGIGPLHRRSNHTIHKEIPDFLLPNALITFSLRASQLGGREKRPVGYLVILVGSHGNEFRFREQVCAKCTVRQF